MPAGEQPGDRVAARRAAEVEDAGGDAGGDRDADPDVGDDHPAPAGALEGFELGKIVAALVAEAIEVGLRGVKAPGTEAAGRDAVAATTSHVDGRAANGVVRMTTGTFTAGRGGGRFVLDRGRRRARPSRIGVSRSSSAVRR
jgi:hypothetical protein